MKRIALLKNEVQEYKWGSPYFIPELLSNEAPSKVPQAELWMGAHPKAPSRVMVAGRWVSLADCIEQDPKGILGENTAKVFDNKLPFLFKVLAAEKPLSIQAHPNRKQAKAGYERENRLGIPLDADNRNYRDDNHKPELICALSSFEGLKGFRKPEEIIRYSEIAGSEVLNAITGVLKNHPDHNGLKDYISRILTLAQREKTDLIQQVMRGAMKAKGKEPCFDWIIRLAREYPEDMGIISPIFLNLFQLKPGEALFIPAGELHAYLGGGGLEIMANSDNVLRGGLTSKHVDVPELLGTLRFEPNPVDILTPSEGPRGEYLFPRTADEFRLSRLEILQDRDYKKEGNKGIEILICIQGGATIIDHEQNRLELKKGDSIIVPADMGNYRMHGEAILYKASVP